MILFCFGGYMKKFVIIFAILICFTLSACGAGDVGSAEYMAEKQKISEASSIAENEPEPTWSNDLDGLAECFEWHSYVLKDTKSQTIADVIGANEGVRYKAQVGKSNFYVELYSYDPNNLNDKASLVINEIQQTGQLTMIDYSVPAIMSNNNKYMMIYSDTSSDELNLNTKQEAIDTFIIFQ